MKNNRRIAYTISSFLVFQLAFWRFFSKSGTMPVWLLVAGTLTFSVVMCVHIYQIIKARREDVSFNEAMRHQQMVAELTHPISAPCTVSVTRQKLLVRNSYPIDVFLNGVRVDKVTIKEPLVFTTVVARNTVSVIYVPNGLQDELQFDAIADGLLELDVRLDDDLQPHLEVTATLDGETALDNAHPATPLCPQSDVAPPES